MVRSGCAASAMALAMGLYSTQARATDPTAFVCTFDRGYFSTSRDSASFTTEPGGKMQLTYAAIDVGKGTAQMIGNQGAANVTVVQGSGGLHFLELTPAGGLTVTSVYFTPGSRGAAAAVHSRHTGDSITGALVSQFFGFCEPRYP
jgi:hypothetical protein